MSRMTVAVALALYLALAVGCGSSSPPTLPKVSLEGDTATPTPVTPATNPEPAAPPAPAVTPKAEPPKGPVWEIDPDKQVIPAAAVMGNLGGVAVTPEALLENGELIFRTLKPGTQIVERKVTLKLAPPPVPDQPTAPVAGRTWKVRQDMPPGPSVPEIWLEEAGKAIQLYPGGYGLTLELSPRKDGKVAGRVFLSLPSEPKTCLAGTFSADYFRPHTERPGPDDAPYITGTVVVNGAKPNAEVRVAYAGFVPEGGVFKELQLAFDPAPETEARWQPEESDRPRTSRLISGDGKSRPFRYEHLRLPPGRYLLSVAVAGGPAAWKWVDVAANSTLAENFVIDASKTGGVEVSTAPGASGKVLIAPADEADRPAMEAGLFQAIAFQVIRQEIDLVAGKATVKNLAPGRYEVRAAGERRVVEIVAGKTAELDMTPPKKP